MAEVILKSYEFRREREQSWQELEQLVSRIESKGIRSLPADDLIKLPSLYRAALSSLSVARSISLDQAVVRYLTSLSGRAYLCVYGARNTLREALADFLFRRFPTAVWAARWYVLVSALFLLLGAATGYLMTAQNEENFYAFVSDSTAQGRGPASTTAELQEVLDRGGSSSQGLATFASSLFSHNAKIGIMCFALGFAFGVPTLLLLLMNGLTIGAFVALYAGRGLAVDFLGWVLIHGVTELLAVVLCGGAGLVLGASLAFPGRQTRLAELARRGRSAAMIALGAVVMFFIAGLIEGFGRQLILNTDFRMMIAIGSLLAWSGYFLWLGARQDDGGD